MPFTAGVACMMLGLLIVLVPQLLIAMVAAMFILFGLVLAMVGWKLRGGREWIMKNAGRFFEQR